LALGPAAASLAITAAAPALGAGPHSSAPHLRPAITARPALSSHFDWNSHDYAIRSDGERVTLRLRVPRGWQGRWNDGTWHGHSVEREIPGTAGRGLSVHVRRAPGPSNSRPRSFYVRLLPRDFPRSTFARRRPGGPALFAVGVGPYAAVFSRNGTPVWWHKPRLAPVDVEPLRDGTIAESSFGLGAPWAIYRPDGHLVRKVASANGLTDFHDIQLLPNGNYMLGAAVARSGVDTSQFGGGPGATVEDAEIEEVTPAGKLVWKWDSGDHVGLAETGRWWPLAFAGLPGFSTPGYDIAHWNSLDVRRHSLLLSFRHFDAIFKISRETGDIDWKLGGTETPKSLRVLADPLGDYPLGGQHDARFGLHHTITAHDNFSGLGPAPRAVRYRINAARGTAKLIGSISDPRFPSSVCCGSARRLASGDWLVSWGGAAQASTDRPLIAGYGPEGRPIFTMRSRFSYRAVPLSPDEVTAAALRRGMDAMATSR
jgi:Arylsulfotransferase (ASST)